MYLVVKSSLIFFLTKTLARTTRRQSTSKKILFKLFFREKKANNGLIIPSTLEEGQPIYFVIDNADLKIDTPDGKGQLHGTGTIVNQKKNVEQHVWATL